MWDEANLERNEEEKVPRMTIDEPPTPYHRYTDSDSDASMDEPIDAAIMAEVAAAALQRQESMDKDDFKEKRKAHYNEFKVAKEADLSQ